ncbi:extracellular calcium-sensing receptor [Saccoglossus kowalevskii]
MPLEIRFLFSEVMFDDITECADIFYYANKNSKHDCFIFFTNRLWIACESWGDSKEVLRQAPTVVDGTIGVLLMEGKIPNFAQHLLKLRPTKKAVKKNPFLAQMWESAFHCSLESQGYMHGSGLSEYVDEVQYNTVVCSHDGNIRNTPVYGNADFRVSYNVYLAVYSIATALNNIIKCVDGAGLLARGRCPDIRKLQPWQLLLYVSNVTFQGTDGHHFNFGKNGDGLGVYHLVNWQLNEDREIKVVPVGHYDNRIQNGSKLRLEDTVIIWNELSRSIPTSECAVPCRPGSRQAVLDGQPKCCHECVPCADGEITNETDLPVCITCPHGFWSNGNHTECMEKIQDYLSWQETSGIVAVCSAILGTLLTVITLMIFATNRYTPIVKAANRELCIMMLVFLSVCFVSCIAFVGRPNELQCKMQIIQGVFHTSCVSIILVKTHRILTIFGSKLPAALQERRFARLQLQLLLLSFLVAIHVALVIALLALSPPGVEMNDDISKTVMYIHCKPSNIIFSLSTSMYTWLVSGICLILAFKSRKLPDNFNEAKFITFAMVLYFIVWSFYYPSSILTYGKLRALFRCLVNIVSAAALLVSIFLPKCYIILCKRELNTKAAIQRVTRQHSMKVTSRALELTPTKRSYSMGSAELNHLNPKERQLSSAEILV